MWQEQGVGCKKVFLTYHFTLSPKLRRMIFMINDIIRGYSKSVSLNIKCNKSIKKGKTIKLINIAKNC